MDKHIHIISRIFSNYLTVIYFPLLWTCKNKLKDMTADCNHIVP